jgi:G3E family GTPase
MTAGVAVGATEGAITAATGGVAGARRRPIPLTVIGGFLGAGKTTLLNGVLEQAQGRRIAVLVNDFGAVSVDASLVSARSARTLSLANGCICCTLVDGLAAALIDVLRLDPPPDHILIEASGVSDPRRIAQVARADPDLRDDGTLVVVAADRIQALASDRHVGDTVLRQIAAADLVVLNKLDLTTARCDDLVAWLRERAPRARIVPAVDARLPCDVVLGPRAFTGEHGEVAAFAVERGDAASCAAEQDDAATFAVERDNGARDRHHVVRAGSVAHATFSTRTLRCTRPLPEAALREALDALPDSVLRAKGYVRLDTAPDTWHVVQAVGRRWSMAPAGITATESVLVMIAARGAVRLDDASAVARLFAAA